MALALALPLPLGILALITPGDTGILLTHPRLEQLILMDRLLDEIIASPLSLALFHKICFLLNKLSKVVVFQYKIAGLVKVVIVFILFLSLFHCLIEQWC